MCNKISNDLGNPNYLFLPPVIGGVVLALAQHTIGEISETHEKSIVMGSLALGVLTSVEIQRRNHNISFEGYIANIAAAGGLFAIALCWDTYGAVL
jgi:hypothetical protein